MMNALIELERALCYCLQDRIMGYNNCIKTLNKRGLHMKRLPGVLQKIKNKTHGESGTTR